MRALERELGGFVVQLSARSLIYLKLELFLPMLIWLAEL